MPRRARRQLLPSVPTRRRRTKEPMRAGSDPQFSQLFVCELGIVIAELSPATRTNVVVLGRVRHPVEKTNWTAVFHKLVLPHSYVKYAAGPPCLTTILRSTG